MCQLGSGTNWLARASNEVQVPARGPEKKKLPNGSLNLNGAGERTLRPALRAVRGFGRLRALARSRQTAHRAVC